MEFCWQLPILWLSLLSVLCLSSTSGHVIPKFFTQILDPKSYKSFPQRTKLPSSSTRTGNEGDIDRGSQITQASLRNYMSEDALGSWIISVNVNSEGEEFCKVIKGSWKQIEDTAKTTDGLELQRKSFRICENYNMSANDLERWIMTALSYAAMTDYPTPSNFLKPLPAYPVRKMCEAVEILEQGDDTFAKISLGLEAWQWPACTEMIMPTEGNNEESIVPAYEWNYQDIVASCNYRGYWITTEFGGHAIHEVLKSSASNVIFFNALSAGVHYNCAIVAKQVWEPIMWILRFSTMEDPQWLTEIREEEVCIISSWISQRYQRIAQPPSISDI